MNRSAIYQQQWFLDENGRKRPKPSADILDDVIRGGYKKILLGISGKDSLALWLYLRDNGFEIIPYMFYTIPGGLSYENISLDYYQNFFGVKIYYLPHPNFIKFWNAGLWQSPVTLHANKIKLPFFDYYQVEGMLAAENNLGDEYLSAIGYRAADNPGRRRLINNMGAIGGQARHYYYGIWDWTIAQVMEIIHKNNAKLSPQYALFGNTFDEYDWFNLKILYRESPGDLEKIKMFFPLILSKVIRYKHAN